MAMKMQAEFGSDMQVIFVEVQGADRETMVSALLDRKWLGGSAIWTTERLFSTGMSGIPNYAVLDADGAVVMTGYSGRTGKLAEDKISELVKLRRKGRKDLPSSIAKLEVLVNKGDYQKALVGAAKLIAKPGSKDVEAVLAGAKMVQARAKDEIASAFARFDWMLGNGYPTLALELHKELSKELARMEDYSEQLGEMGATIASDVVKAELYAEKSFAKIKKSIDKDGGDDKQRKKLLKLVAKHTGTAVAKRASFLANLM